jgi:hypothetical protein
VTCRREISIPFINGKYYINPTFGRAIELARMSEEEQRAAEPQHEPAHKGRHGGSGDSHDPATTTEGVANQIYNETAGLRTTDQRGNGPGSDWELQQARFAMAHVIRNRATSGIKGGLASEEINHRETGAIGSIGSRAYDAHGESVYAAHRSGKQADPTSGATHFYFDYGQTSAPTWGKQAVAIYGPFRNAAGGGDVNKGADVKIVIAP